MKEIKNIDQLFKAAKEESPQVSFEKVAKRFEISLEQGITPSRPPTLFSKLFNLNNLLLMVAITSISAILFWLSMPSVEPVSDNTISQITPEKVVATPLKKENENTIISTPPILAKQSPKANIAPPIIVQKEETNNDLIIQKNKKISNEIVKETVATSTPISTTTQPKIEQKKADSSDSKPIHDNLAIHSNKKESTKSIAPKPTTSIDNLSEIPPKTEKIISKKDVLLLTRYDNQKQVNNFVKSIQTYGIQADFSVHKRAKKTIKKLTLQMNHSEGLDWRIKLQDFEQLEIKVLLDEQQNIYGITYRLNQNGDFAEYLTLKHKGRSFHKFAGKGTKSRHSHTRRLVEN